jgi:hypothetical protein
MRVLGVKPWYGLRLAPTPLALPTKGLDGVPSPAMTMRGRCPPAYHDGDRAVAGYQSFGRLLGGTASAGCQDAIHGVAKKSQWRHHVFHRMISAFDPRSGCCWVRTDAVCHLLPKESST